ncbi:MAG: hypothetical protein HYU81_03035 [Candidatus Brennerbacteria bacterium]|nr:hypothetical protein [Candidatus Brennerbacteria bacterium]
MTKTRFEWEEVLADYAAQDALLHVPLGDRAFKVFLLIAVGVAVAVGAKVFALAGFKYDFYRARAEANMTDVRVEPAPRGIIRDRFGAPLVSNVPSWSAALVLRDFPAGSDERNAALARLAVLFGEDAADLRTRVAAKDWNVSERLVLADGLSRETLIALAADPIPGVRVERSFARVSAHPFAYAHLLGYTGRVGTDDLARDERLGPESVIGRTGLEASYDEWLRGKDGRTVTYRNARGEPQGETRYEAPTAGAEVRTFIDGEFQEFLYDRLARALRELGRTAGAALAMDPRNGEVRALVSIPSFEPAAVAKYLTSSGNPLFNRPLQGTYNPGSTIKPVVGIAALSEGVIGSEDRIFSAGFIEVPNPYDSSRPTRFPDNQAHGWVDIRSALARSSNIYFYEVAGGFERQRGIGIETLNEWWKRFGLGEATGIDLPGEKKGFLPDPAWKETARGEPWRVGDTYHVAIGQGDLTVTPLGLLDAIAAIANGGTLWRPQVARAVEKEGETKILNESEVRADLSARAGEAIPEVREGMRDVVRAPYGTARSLADLPLAVAAKTGTAQVSGNAKLNAFFAGYAPADDPELALLILVEDAREGSLNTIPVARDAFLWYYDHRIKK